MANQSDNNKDYDSIYKKFKESYNDIVKNLSLPFNFNILDAQCGTIKENSHTNILMKLLGYKNQHGYVFLKDFIEMAGFEINLDGLKYDENVVFETEYFNVASSSEGRNKKGRIDGLIYQMDKFAFIIENKVNGAPNQDEQLKKYIDFVIKEMNGKGLVSSDKVFVVFLTKDGVESPDSQSIDYMRGEEIGILNPLELGEESESISGPRYFACSYRYDILPWLENNVQPYIYQKESILNTGLVQYIDFLKGMLGQRDSQTLLQERCKNIFNEILKSKLPNYDKDNFKRQNDYLHSFYNYLQKRIKYYQKKSDNESKIKVDYINLLQNLVYEKAEEPMSKFMEATKEFFTSGDSSNPPLIDEKDYRVNHHFTFYYIDIRDKNWPKGVNIGWYPAHLLDDDPSASLYYTMPSDTEANDQDVDDNGFIYSSRGKAWRKEYSQKRACEKEQKLLSIDNVQELKELYEKSSIRRIIESIKLQQ